MGRVVGMVVVGKGLAGRQQDRLSGVAVVLDPSVTDPDDPGEVGAEGLEVVGDDPDRDSLATERAKHLDQRGLCLDIDAGGRLVEQQELGLSRKRPCNQDAALLSAGQLVDGSGSQVGDVDALHRAIDGLAVGSAGEPPESRARQTSARDHFTDGGGNRATDGLPLRHVSDAPPLPVAAGGNSEEVQLTGAPFGEAEDRLDQSRLPGAVGPNDGDELASADREVDVAQDRGIGVPEGGPPQLDECLGQRQDNPSCRLVRFDCMTCR